MEQDTLNLARQEAAEMFFYSCIDSLQRSRDYKHSLMNMSAEKKRKFLGLPHVRNEMNPYFSRDHWFKHFIKKLTKEETKQNEKVSG